jgi:hypothetical protein
MCLKYFCWAGLSLYALLSVADWALTYALLRAHPGAVESNPVAAAFLEQHGWGGLALFKFAVVLVFTAAVVMILRRRPAVAAGVVGFGCAALLWVTTYSHGLLAQAHREAAEQAAAEWPSPKKARPGEGVLDILARCWVTEETTATPPPTRSAALSRRLPTP